MQFVPNEKATPIRVPSTANLMVDSADRNRTVNRYCNDFQITKTNSILNGFFTRIGTTEVVFEWVVPNVDYFGNGGFTYDTTGTLPTQNTFGLAGFYNMEEAVNAVIEELNTFTAGTGLTWTVAGLLGGGVQIIVTGGVNGNTFAVDSPLLIQMFKQNLSGTFGASGIVTFDFNISLADLRPTRYIDIVCNQLTNNQAVKDASTAPIVRDVLCRWYFDQDYPVPNDAYGYPILMGYSPFYLRRLYNPPKQIQWQTNIPIGNLSFQLYNERGTIVDVNSATNYLMTLQVSEN